MKKLILIIAIVFSGMLMQAQKNFIWDDIINMSGSKDELYSKAKMVIADLYNSAQDVTQNSDAGAGIIQLKAMVNLAYSRSSGFQNVTYYYKYSLKIMFKDDKYRVILDNVYADGVDAVSRSKGWSYPPVSEDYVPNVWKVNVNKKQYAEMMADLKARLQAIVSEFNKGMKKAVVIDSDW